MYEALPLINGFPGKTTSHGSFGWSSVWLLRGQDRVVMVETGPPSYLSLLTDALAELGLSADDVTDVLITHAHWDHLGNVSLLQNARRWIGDIEYHWATEQRPDEPFVSQPLLGALDQPVGLLRLTEARELFPGVRALNVPGHTPGHLAFEVETHAGPMLFVGDAAKNLHELSTLTNDSALDMQRGAQSLAWIRDIAATRGGVVVPGHDVACVLVDGQWQRLHEQQAQLEFFHRHDSAPVHITVSDSSDGVVTIKPHE